MEDSRLHWEHIYSTKQPNEVSWTQQVPHTSLEFIKGLNLPLSSKIIDIGGGDSNLVDNLLEQGYTDITVLDISEAALERAKHRLGPLAVNVKWVVSDITEFKPDQKYDLWHDRAAFHFMTSAEQVSAYRQVAANAAQKFMIISTFSESGPEKCSGLPIKRYSECELQAVFTDSYEKLDCLQEDHRTPFETVQNFLFCSFKRIASLL